MNRALILVDIQNDFLPGGALAVPDGDAILPVVNQMMADFEFVVATQDWHPADHGSFASNHSDPDSGVGMIIELDGLQQLLWPDHCVENTRGAELSSDLDRGSINQTVQKGTNPNIDSYSGFFDNARRQATPLEKILRENDIEEVHVVGLATDYCVKFTALDSTDLGFKTIVYRRAVRGVELKSGDCAAAFEEMKTSGVLLIGE